MLGKQWNIALASAQRRQRDHFERQAIEQVGAEFPVVDLGREVFVGRGDDPDVDEIYDHVVRLMQDTLDALAAERRLPVLG